MRAILRFCLWPVLSVALLAQIGPVNLRDGTLVRLKVLHSISSDSAKAGDVVELQVTDDVKAEGMVVIARGNSSWATVESRTVSPDGLVRLTIRLGTVSLPDGNRALLRASSDRTGATSEIDFEALTPNKPLTIEEGTTAEAYVHGDVWIRLSPTPPVSPPNPILPLAPVPGPTQSATPNTPNPKLVLEDGTPLKLRISRTVSSAEAQVGETVDFEVLEEVRVGDVLVIPKGGVAWATVTEAQSKRRLGRGGKLGMNIDSVRLVDGEKAALRAVKDVKGGGHGGAMTGAIVGTAIVFWPAAPLFLLIHGKDITVPKGTEITAYINGNVPLDSARLQPPAPAQQVMAAPAAADPRAALDISSTPPGADIELDGSFVGNTPSSIGVQAGEHSIKITKTGYIPWERKIRISSGSVKVVADLQR